MRPECREVRYGRVEIRRRFSSYDGHVSVPAYLAPCPLLIDTVVSGDGWIVVVAGCKRIGADFGGGCDVSEAAAGRVYSF